MPNQDQRFPKHRDPESLNPLFNELQRAFEKRDSNAMTMLMAAVIHEYAEITALVRLQELTRCMLDSTGEK